MVLNYIIKLGTQKILTPDLGGKARTEDVGKAIADLVLKL